MPDPIDALVTQWRHDPSPAATVALCEALRESPQRPLVQQVGEFAVQQHASDVTVLVSVARMYVQSQRVTEAQTVLLAAGKQAPRDARVYRWLGEVLLRRGDATRATKVLERALQFAPREPEAQMWLGHARGYETMQTAAGENAVAVDVAKRFAQRHSAPAPAPMSNGHVGTNGSAAKPGGKANTNGLFAAPAASMASETPTRVAAAPPSPPSEPPTAANSGRALLAPAALRSAPAPAAVHSAPAPTAVRSAPAPTAVHSAPAPTAVRSAPAPTAVRSAPAPAAARSAPAPVRAAQPPAAPQAPTAPPIPARLRNADFADPALAERSPAPGSYAPHVPPTPARHASNSRAPSAFARPVQHVARSAAPAVPYPRDVLDALTLSGIFEPNANPLAVRWDRAAPGPKRKGTATLITAMTLFLAGSVGVYFAYRHKRAGDHVQAEAVLATVESELHASRPDTLPNMEKELARALQLESRNPRAALDWTRERAMVGLLKSGDDVAFEDAMARAKETGIPEEKYAFARVASFLLQGDTAGAAGMMPRWDGPAAGDAWYQLVTGAALERAGDARAAERYSAALKLDPELVAADIGLARVTALEGDTQAAMRMAVGLRGKLPDRAEPVALVALAWGRDSNRDNVPPPPEVADLAKRGAELTAALQFVAHAVAALQAIDRHAPDEARGEIEKGLAVAGSPGAAVWLGSIALQLDNEPLARRAALAALQFSAIYEPARALAARVALSAGRLDEALKATEELDAATVEVAVVRAAVAYERADADNLARALSALRPNDRHSPYLAALTRAQGELFGTVRVDATQLLSTADDDAPWSDLVAMDVALDQADLATADKMALDWGKDDEANPLRAVRLARLARYENRLDVADTFSQVALDHGTVTPRVLSERAFVLVAKNRAGDVGPLLARYPLVLGPLATWLGAYAQAAAGQVDAAKAKVATLDPPPDGSIFGARLVAAAAFGEMKEHKRGTPYVKDLLAGGSLHPDLVSAALALGMRRVDHGKRRPTYE